MYAQLGEVILLWAGVMAFCSKWLLQLPIRAAFLCVQLGEIILL